MTNIILTTKEREALDWLVRIKRISQSRFVGLLNIDYNRAKVILKHLEEEGLIKKEIETNSVYYTLSKNKK